MGQDGNEIQQPILIGVVYHGQQADGTPGAQTPMRGGRSCLPVDDILQPPSENIINHTW